MSVFLETTHLSDILEDSSRQKVVIFKYSSQCGTSSRLAKELKILIENKSITHPVYKVTVQIHSSLSKKIEEWFGIKHESPQVFLIENGKVLYSAHHHHIDTEQLKK